MKYAVEMGLCAIMYIPDFINVGSTIQKLIWREGFKDGIMIA
jgi:hypothetical protein